MKLINIYIKKVIILKISCDLCIYIIKDDLKNINRTQLQKLVKVKIVDKHVLEDK